MTPSPPPVRVAVNDRQLPVVAVVEQGRVLVPLRAIAEALHIDVASIHLPLKKPARVIAGRWYAPVRAMANLVHATINYDAKARIVAVYSSSTPVAVGISGQEPASGSRVGSAYPTISASLDLPNGSSIRTIRVMLDNVDRTLDAIYQGTYVTYIPRSALAPGTHTVEISGVTSSGVPFTTDWSFETTSPPPPPDNGLGYGSWNNGLAYLQLTVPGTQFIGGAPVPVQLIAPPNGTAFAYVCTSTWQYQLFSAPQSQFYSGSVPTERVPYPISCPITAFYVDPRGGVTYAPYPQVIQLLPQTTPQPTPSPTRIPVPTPIATRTPAPYTPAPTATPLPPPVTVHSPIPIHSPKPHKPTPEPDETTRPKKTPPPSQ